MGDNSDGETWASAYTNLQSALDEAAPGDTIHMAGDTFSINEQLEWTVSGITVRGGYEGDGTPGDNDPDQWPTIIERSGENEHRIIYINGADDSTLENVTLTGGYLTNSAQEAVGAGLLIADSDRVTLSGCIINNNSYTIGNDAGARGGAGLAAMSSEVTLTNCIVRGNAGLNTRGHSTWGRAWGGGIWSDGTLTIRDCKLVNNSALSSSANAHGGGIYFSGTTLEVKNVLITGNITKYDGGGLYLNSGAVTMNNCTVADNTREGIYNAGGTVSVSDSILWGNLASNIVGEATVSYSNIGDDGYAGEDNNISADPLFEYGYYLAAGSPCIAAGSDTASNLGLADYARNRAGDTYAPADIVNMGYHYSGGYAVTYTDLYVSPDGNDANAGTGPGVGEAFRTLTQALATALDRDGTRIHVAAGIYTEATGETFPLTVTDRPGIQILGADAETTALDAGGSESRVMMIENSHRAVLQDITLTGGEVRDGTGLRIENSQGVLLSGCIIEKNVFEATGLPVGGAGMYALSSAVTLINCLVQKNSGHNEQLNSGAHMRGGGIWSYDGILEIIDSAIVGNTCSTGDARPTASGGGIHLGARRVALGRATLRNVLVAGNRALCNNPSGGYTAGAGIHIDDNSILFLDNCTVTDHAGEGIRSGEMSFINNSIVWGNWTNIVGEATVSYSNIGDDGYAGENNNISADPLFEYGYYLAAGSPCLAAGSDTAENLGLAGYARNSAGDTYDPADIVNMGYHYSDGYTVTYTDLYVSPDGNDANAGTGPGAGEAFRTLTQALTTAIDRDGTRIHVASGIYTEATGETFPLTVMDRPRVQILGADAETTALDAGGSESRVMALENSHRAVLQDITLTGGDCASFASPLRYRDGGGAGLYIENSQGVLVSGCIITNNAFDVNVRDAFYGAGLNARASSVTVSNCIIKGNSGNNRQNHGNAHTRGGGLASDGIMTIRDSAISDNIVENTRDEQGRGGGIFFDGELLDMKNVLIADNSAEHFGDGIHINDLMFSFKGIAILENVTIAGNDGEGLNNERDGPVSIKNSILWDNIVHIVGAAEVSYSNVGDAGYEGENGNISVDPLFAGGGDYHLRSRKGRWTPDGWVSDSEYSPCIDMGDPDSPVRDEPYPNMDRINMGAYGGTYQASKSKETGTVFLFW